MTHTIGACAIVGFLAMTVFGRTAVYPQTFDQGGRSLDCQFMDVMGSSYLLAHGLGRPVTDARTSVSLPSSGSRLAVVPGESKTAGRILADGIAIEPLPRQTDPYVLPSASLAVVAEGANAKARLFGKIDKSRIVGHRGDSEVAPENTMPALRMAAEQGFSFETDVYMTKDGVAVLFHDRYIHRGKYAIDGWVTNLAWRGALENVDAGVWKGERWKGVRFATLDDALSLAADGRKIFLDVKEGEGIVEAIVDSVSRHPNVNPSNLVFLSGGWLHKSLPDYMDFKAGRPRKGWWTTDPPRDLMADARALDVTKIGAWNLRWDEELVTKELIDFVHSRGLKVNVWTVNDAATAWAAFGRGADWVCTDRPSSLWKEMTAD